MKTFAALFILTLLSFQTFAQEKRTLSGYITDATSGEKLFGASIFDTVSRQGAATNDYGFFSLTIPNEDAFLRVSYFGLKTKYLLVPKGTNELDIQLDLSLIHI